MPMVEYRYNPLEVTDEQAEKIGQGLEAALRETISKVRPERASGYGVTVEGDPFRIAHKQENLRIYVFYHAEWLFTPEELRQLADEMVENLKKLFHKANIEFISTVVRFYARSGHASSFIS